MQSLESGHCEIVPGICAHAYNQGSYLSDATALIKSKFGVGGHCDNVSHQVHKTLYFYSILSGVEVCWHDLDDAVRRAVHG